jgi:hypothetical protein
VIRPLSDKTILRQELPKQVTDAGLHLLKQSVYTEAVRPGARWWPWAARCRASRSATACMYHVQDATEFKHEGDTLQLVAGEKVIAVLEAAKPRAKKKAS